ncbi:hypothetical protein D0864_06132 [Hortaea werneckii]|uniref:Major facilitator superfamily (MFS) profile domain-containing protein n=1 Tax=Hortaea werneckii TaxID=91943 RepID=A0A3M7GRW6_HORWE|nr:MFS general substrate transporter [Hortaea werneckii]KAI6867069.1 MFS general substrate transporter [Hortaea werneckii]KAI7353125.1 MFS general substrate transporter [Hortaea werneckii]RMY91074.1 hypothetical protein D0864_06132 [Hortaea werneckii]RMZ03475.1 hypothetical protein D0862_05631 [Hortaea werneckii]
MSALFKPFVWFYREFGVAAIHETGRNAYIIILTRTLRMLAYGTNSLILALFFAELQFSDYRIGLFFSLTLLGDVLLGVILTLVADRVGRRKILCGGSILMAVSGTSFAIFENYWVLLFAAVVGIISATGGDYGPFRAIEESMLSHLTNPQTRADVLAWYVTLSSLGSAVGSELSGRLIKYFRTTNGWDLRTVYHSLFWLYTVMGIINAVLTLLLTKECEMEPKEEYASVPQEDEDGNVRRSATSAEVTNSFDGNGNSPAPASSGFKEASKFKKYWSQMSRWLAQISAPTRSTMYKLWPLLAVDSLADGMVPYPLTNYYVDNKFHPAKSTLGDVTAVAFFLGAISSVFAGPLARKIGLINTMVFTHIPSSAAVLAFPAPGSLWLTVVLLLVRAGLNNMDQAPRSAFIAAVVKPEERTAVMGITSTLKTLAAMAGPSLTGLLAGGDRFWIAFVAAGALRLAYDIGLYVLFINMKLYQHEPDFQASDNHQAQYAEDSENEMDELLSPSITDSSDEDRGSKGHQGA